jgi:hypothetical protein
MGTNELKLCTLRKKLFYIGPTKAAQGRTKISCTGMKSPTNQPREGPLSFVLFKVPFASVSTVSMGYPNLVSLVGTKAEPNSKIHDWGIQSTPA